MLCLLPIDRLYYEKNEELRVEANKLLNGLGKIDDTREKVVRMSVELEEAKVKVVEFQNQCDDYLTVLVQQKQEADEQQKVNHSSEVFCQASFFITMTLGA